MRGRSAPPASCAATAVIWLVSITLAVAAVTGLFSILDYGRSGSIESKIDELNRDEAAAQLDDLWKYAWRSWLPDKRSQGAVSPLFAADDSLLSAPRTFGRAFPSGAAYRKYNDEDLRDQIRGRYSAIDQRYIDPYDKAAAEMILPISPLWPLQQYEIGGQAPIYSPMLTECRNALEFRYLTQIVNAPYTVLLMTTFSWDQADNPVDTTGFFIPYDSARFDNFLTIFDGLGDWIDYHIQNDVFAKWAQKFGSLKGTANDFDTLMFWAVFMDAAVDSSDPFGLYGLWNQTFDIASRLQGFVPSAAQTQAYLDAMTRLKPKLDAWIQYLSDEFPYSTSPANDGTYWTDESYFYGLNSLPQCPMNIFKSMWYPYARDGDAIVDWTNALYDKYVQRAESSGKLIFGDSFTYSQSYDATGAFYAAHPEGAVPPHSTNILLFPENFCSSGQNWRFWSSLEATNLTSFLSFAAPWIRYGGSVALVNYTSPDGLAFCDNAPYLFTVYMNAVAREFNATIAPPVAIAMGAFPGYVTAALLDFSHEMSHAQHTSHAKYNVPQSQFRLHRPGPVARAYLTKVASMSSQGTEGFATFAMTDVLEASGLAESDAGQVFGSAFTMSFVYLPAHVAWINVNLGGWTVDDLQAFMDQQNDPSYTFTAAEWYAALQHAVLDGVSAKYIVGLYRWERLLRLAVERCGPDADALQGLYARALHRGRMPMELHEFDVQRYYIERGCPGDYNIAELSF